MEEYNVIRVNGDDSIDMVDGDGNVFASTKNGDFTAVVAYGDGYYFLFQNTSGFDIGEQYLFIVDRDGNTIFDRIPYEFESSFNYTGVEYAEKDIYDKVFFYCGLGIGSQYLIRTGPVIHNPEAPIHFYKISARKPIGL